MNNELNEPNQMVQIRYEWLYVVDIIAVPFIHYLYLFITYVDDDTVVNMPYNNNNSTK